MTGRFGGGGLALLGTIAAAAVGLSCQSEDQKEEPVQLSAICNAGKLTVEVGETITVESQAHLPAGLSGCDFIWAIEPPGLASLQSAEGCDGASTTQWQETATFEAMAPGTVQIRGKPDFEYLTNIAGDNLCTFTIVDPDPDPDSGPNPDSGPDSGLDAASAPDAGACTEVVFDETFEEADWAATIVMSTSTGPTSFSAAQEASGGNPGEHRAMTHEWCGDGAGSKGITVAHVRQGVSHSGALTAISLSYDVRCKPSAINNGMGFGPLIKQGDTFYKGKPFFTAVADLWLTQSPLHLGAGQFVRLSGSGPAQPDFSGGGAPIELGYYSSNGTGADRCLVQDCGGLDNYRVCVHTQ